MVHFPYIVLEYTPNVIEPSFGIGRILYSLLEHCYYVREGDEQRGVFKFPPAVAPTKVLVLPLSNHSDFELPVRKVATKLRKMNISNKTDSSSGSIGRRYARNDEVGIPFAVAIDFQTLKDETVTLRERDSTKQIRATVDQILEAVDDLIENRTTWAALVSVYGEFAQQEL
jgi:glycyl-tRNA synthetase